MSEKVCMPPVLQCISWAVQFTHVAVHQAEELRAGYSSSDPTFAACSDNNLQQLALQQLASSLTSRFGSLHAGSAAVLPLSATAV